MASFRTRVISLLVAGTLLAAAGCSPTVTTRGNLLPPAKIEQVQPMSSYRADVVRLWGPPSTVSPFDANTWYYIGETSAQKGIFEAEVKKRQTIRVTFDETDRVTDVALLDPALAHNVDVVDRKTPTAGKEYTAVQQFVGNLGKFNTDAKGNSAPGGGR